MECFFCKLPLTSDDFKQDKVEETKSFIAHRDCVDQDLSEYVENFKTKYTFETKN